MRKRRSGVVHPPGILERLIDQVRGREQVLVRAGEDLPLLLISYPRGKVEAALEWVTDRGYEPTFWQEGLLDVLQE